MSGQPLDILAFIADDRFGVTYKPRWNAVTGSMAASILLQQIVYRWAHSGRRPFYKFARPCDHRLYRAGDSWEEELALKRREFENARAALAVRTRGELAPDALVSYWVDAQRVTWYALNEVVFLQRFAVLYPQAGVGLQLPLPAAAEPMDDTYIASNGRNVHQPPRDLMNETSISSNVPNIHQLMDETAIASDGRNGHPLYSQNEITSQKGPKTTTAAPAAEPAPPVAAAADPLAPVLDWIAFDDALTPDERRRLDLATLLAWAYWVKLKQAEPRGRVYNPVGLVRAQWRAGKPPRADLANLARRWLALDNDARGHLLARLEWASDYSAFDPAADPDDEFPGFPFAAAAAVYRAAGRQLAPPSLMPPVCPPDRSTPAPQSRPSAHRSVPQTDDPPAAWPLWPQVLSELEMQMTKATYASWFAGTTAAETADGLVVHLKNEFALDWVQNRLHAIVQRAVDHAAGRPLPVRYALVADAVQEAHP